jgi:hypothetical protein
MRRVGCSGGSGTRRGNGGKAEGDERKVAANKNQTLSPRRTMPNLYFLYRERQPAYAGRGAGSTGEGHNRHVEPPRASATDAQLSLAHGRV